MFKTCHLFPEVVSPTDKSPFLLLHRTASASSLKKKKDK